MTQDQYDIEDIKKLKVAKYKCLQSLLFFTRYFYKKRFSRKYIVAEPHIIICEALEKVLRGETTRLIINIAPRYGKTELGVKNFIAHGLALNSASKFIHLTYSQNLALDNSEEAKDIVQSDWYQEMFDVKVKRDSKAKNKWYTTAGGGVYAAATGGQVTGFGAGKVDEPDDYSENDIVEFLSTINAKEGFAGAIVIDDSIKPEDAHSEVKRKRVNDRFETTLRNRVNSRKTPIIVIGQRVHPKDLPGYLIDIEPGEWTVVTLPCLKDDGTALWDLKHTAIELLKLKRINEFVFNSQYQQKPDELQRGGEFLYNFDYKRNVKDIQYDPTLPVNISIDSNVYPYIAITIWQKVIIKGEKMRIRQVHELPAEDPENTASQAGLKIARWLKAQDYTEKVFLYGDRSTKNRNNIDDDKRSFFQIINETLINNGFRTEDKILNAPPSVSSVGDFVNAVLSGEMDFGVIEINKFCIHSINDYQQTKKDDNGNMLKLRIKHPSVEGATYEKNGHLTDTFKDFIVQSFYAEYMKYINKNTQLKPGGISEISRGFEGGHPTLGNITF